MARGKLSNDSHGPEDASFARRAHLAFEVLFEGKWTIQVLCALRREPVRLGQLGRLVPGASKKMLAHCLRKLEADKIVVRHDLSDIILHVEYELHEEVRDSVGELLDHLAKWGDEYVRAAKDQRQKPTDAEQPCIRRASRTRS